MISKSTFLKTYCSFLTSTSSISDGELLVDLSQRPASGINRVGFARDLFSPVRLLPKLDRPIPVPSERRKRSLRGGQQATIIAMEHSRAVNTATWVVVAENARATTRAIDINIAIPPRLKIDTRPQNRRRARRRFCKRKKGRTKTTLASNEERYTHEIGDDVGSYGWEKDA